MTIHERAERLWRLAGEPRNRSLAFWIAAERFETTCCLIRQWMACERMGVKLSSFGKTPEEVAEALVVAEATGATLCECEPAEWSL